MIEDVLGIKGDELAGPSFFRSAMVCPGIGFVFGSGSKPIFWQVGCVWKYSIPQK